MCEINVQSFGKSTLLCLTVHCVILLDKLYTYLIRYLSGSQAKVKTVARTVLGKFEMVIGFECKKNEGRKIKHD